MMSSDNTAAPYRPFRCSICPRTFRSDQTLQTHIRAHASEPERRHTCPHCSFASILCATLQIHLLTHSENPRPFLCPLCPRTFSRRTNLTTHIRTHDNSRPRRFSCPYCKHRTDRRNDLESHIISRHQVVCNQEERFGWESGVLPAFGWDTPRMLPSFDNEAFFTPDTIESNPTPDPPSE